IFSGRSVAIIGKDVAELLFGTTKQGAGEIISIGNIKYKVLGILKEKGASLVSTDNIIFIPIDNARNNFSWNKRSYRISVSVSKPSQLEPAIGEATGVLRSIRKLELSQDDNFAISRSDSLAAALIDNLKYIAIAASVIGFITLFGASVGLMNIMLVAINERTREIGVSMALGANRKVILRQFLIEAIIICQIGGLFGVILGIIAGNIVSVIFNSSFIIPWIWILLGIFLCFVVGIAAGIYPAVKASKLDPIEALRHE
ncbi:MAG: FtsX-like permease family protein, partial [Bacteroidetes bacterium]|nr:FtsX-like permease family protein [Bacteroidota bacterium]